MIHRKRIRRETVIRTQDSYHLQAVPQPVRRPDHVHLERLRSPHLQVQTISLPFISTTIAADSIYLTASLLHIRHLRTNVDTVVVPEIVESDVFFRVIASICNHLHNAMTTAID